MSKGLEPESAEEIEGLGAWFEGALPLEAGR